MTPEETKNLISELLKLDSRELGIFISLLSNEYIKNHKCTKEEFITSLSNSIEKLQEEQ